METGKRERTIYMILEAKTLTITATLHQGKGRNNSWSLYRLTSVFTILLYKCLKILLERLMQTNETKVGKDERGS